MTLSEFKKKVKAGDEPLCVKNTYRPELDGTTRKLTKVGPSVMLGTFEGTPFRTEWPKASDVLEVTETRITFRLGRDDHTITLERVA